MRWVYMKAKADLQTAEINRYILIAFCKAVNVKNLHPKLH